MTQTIFGFGEPLPVGARVTLLSTDQGNIAGKAVDPAAVAVTPASVGAVLLAAEANVRYADKAGSAGGTGSRAQPFLTIQQAITACVLAGATQANPFLVKFGVGTFADPFLYEPGVWVVGQDENASICANPAAQQLSAAFSAAGTQETGLQNCTIGANVNIDFTAMASPGAGRFYLKNCLAEANVTAVGNNTSNRLFLTNCPAFNAARTLTVTNLGQCRSVGTLGAFNWNLVHTCTGGFNCGFIADFHGGNITINGTSATNFATYAAGHTQSTAPIFTGDRVLYSPGVGATHRIFIPVGPAATLVAGTSVSAGGIHMATNGIVAITSFNGAGAPLALTWVGVPSALNAGTRVQFRGGGVGSVTTMIGITSFPTQVDALEDVYYYVDGGGMVQVALSSEQFGFVTLVNGVSPVITLDQPAVIATFAPDAPHASQATALTGHFTYAMNASTEIGELLITNINSVGTRAAGTSNFQIESRRPGTPGAVAVGDQRSIMWRAHIARG